MKTARLPIALAIAAIPFALQAQESGLATVVVTARPVADQGFNKSQIDQSSLTSLRAATSDTASLLRDVPGVSLYGAGGVSSLPAIHGLADDRLNIQVDGVGIVASCPNHMNSALSYIDPTNVAAVKVWAGIAPVSVGGDSIGGSVQIISAPPEFAAPGQETLFKGQAGAFYRSNGSASGANLEATVAGENVNVTYSGSTAHAGNYHAAKDFKPTGNMVGTVRNWLAGDEVASSMYKSENQELGVALRNENHLFEFKVGVQHVPYEYFPNQRMDMLGNNSTQVNLHYTGEYRWGTLEARVYGQSTRHGMDFGDDKKPWSGTMPMKTDGQTKGALVQGNIALSERDTLRVGSELQDYRLNDWWPAVPGTGMGPNPFQNINNGRRDRFDVFAEWEALWSPRWVSQFGVRSDTIKANADAVHGYSANNDSIVQLNGLTNLHPVTAFNNLDRQRTDHNWDLTALARYTPAETQSFEAGYAQKTRSPNLYQRYTWSPSGMMLVMNNFVGDGNGYIGNVNLKPEVAHTLSATADWHDAAKERWGLKVTPYYTQVQDYIDAQRCPLAVCGNTATMTANLTAANKFVYLQYVNQSTKLYGMDVSGHTVLGRNTDYGSFTGTGVLSYVRGENRTNGDNLYNIMPLNAKLAVVQSLGTWTNTAEVQMVAAKTHVSQVRNEIHTGGYGLFNLRSSYAWKQARLDMGIENVFNRFYSLPLGGAYIGQGMDMSALAATSPPWGVPVPGMGRSFYTALNVKF